MKNRALGRGLSALLKEDIMSVVEDKLVKILDIDKIEVGNYQPRKKFEYDKIKELADSIANSGLLQPIIVSPNQEGKYQIVAGERRWRAAKIAGLNEIPVIIRNLNNQEILEIALVENIQREGLSVIEEAEGFERLITEFGYTQEQISQILGKSRSHIANLLRLNHLPQIIKDKVIDGKLTMGHARCLIGHDHAEAISSYIIDNDLSVRQTENLVKDWAKREYIKIPNGRQINNDRAQAQDNDLQLLARSLSEKFGVKITIEDYPVGGKIIFHYNNLEQLDTILFRIG